MKSYLSLANIGSWLLIGTACLFFLSSIGKGPAYERYRDPDTLSNNCFTCHGAFSGSTSPQGTVFPSDSKHEMHRDNASMGTDCSLCHTNRDDRNPFIGGSDGTANNPKLGCTGCHLAAGLRAHHARNGVDCYECHDPAEKPALENVKPPYYGTIDTKANRPENLARVADTNENWSVGDFLGLDNDGNNLYDAADFACAPYRVLSAIREGSNVRVTWSTAGGRRDAVQASGNVVTNYSNLGTPITIPSTGIITTNYLHVGGATNGTIFYRISYQP